MEPPPSDYLAKVIKTAVGQAVTDLAREKLSGDKRRHEHGSYGSKLSSLASIGVSISIPTMYKRVSRKLKQLEAEKISEPPSVIVPAASSNDISSLSPSSPSSGDADPHERSEPDDSEESTKPKSGRPKGSYLEKNRADVKSYKECVSAIAHHYAKERLLYGK